MSQCDPENYNSSNTDSLREDSVLLGMARASHSANGEAQVSFSALSPNKVSLGVPLRL